MSVEIPGRDPIALLNYEAKRRPEIKALIDNLPNMTREEIMAAKVPLKWYRDALLKLHRVIEDERIHADTAASMAGRVTHGVVGDPLGLVLRWTGCDTFMRLDGETQLEVRYGMLAWFPLTGGVWIDTVFANFIDPQFSSCERVQEATKTEYSNMLRARRLKELDLNAPHLVPPAQVAPYTIQRI